MLTFALAKLGLSISIKAVQKIFNKFLLKITHKMQTLIIFSVISVTAKLNAALQKVEN